MIDLHAINPKLGCYTVNGKKYFSKIQALTESTRTGHFPEWDFNKAAFEKVNWAVEPETNLRELYRLRAQQLRDQYDWIRLEASGGGDSTTALLSFINNGIHLDEIVFRYPKTGDKNATDDPYNYKPENTLSEFRYAALPLLQWVATHAPQTKITIHDYAEDMISSKHDESWVLRTQDYFQPGHAFKHATTGTDEHKNQADSGMNICVLYGVDKPKVCIKDKKWYAYFLDITANHAVSDQTEYTNIHNEYFYWSPDLPELIVKQSHIVRKWFDLPQNKVLQYVCRWPNYSFIHKNAYESIIKPLIYPDYDPTTFQTGKPTNSFYNEMDQWFYQNFQDTHQYRAWKAGLSHLVNTIDKKFFNYEMGQAVGFIGFISPFYYLGEAEFEDSGVNKFTRF